MDIFVVCENDPYRVVSKLEELGIRSVDVSGVKASGQVWFEEEGRYLGEAELIIALVDRAFMEDECDRYAMNLAKNRQKTVWVLYQGREEAPHRAFDAQYTASETFYEPSKLIHAVVEYQIAKSTDSGLSMRADMYYRAFMLNESLSTCCELIERYREKLSAYPVGDMQGEGAPGDYRRRLMLRQSMCATLELAAEIFFIKEQYGETEGMLWDAWYLIESDRVIWAEDHRLYLLTLLKTLYERYVDDESKYRTVESKTRNALCFGTSDKDRREKTAAMRQRVALFYEKGLRLQQKYRREQMAAQEKPNDSIHRLIAEHIRSSVLLFNELAKEGVVSGFGECLKTSYERLLEYCRITGDAELCTRCMDLIASNLKNPPQASEDTRDAAEKNLKCIKAYLGKTLPDSGYYDVFLSHRSADISLASEVYAFLKEKGKEPFLDKVSLPILGDSEYRRSILSALDNSAHFVLVASDLSFSESRWVMQELDLFCDEKREGRKNGNLLLVFPEAVCQRICAENKKSLPIQLRSFEILSYETFRETLLPYIL